MGLLAFKIYIEVLILDGNSQHVAQVLINKKCDNARSKQMPYADLIADTLQPMRTYFWVTI